MVWVTGGIGVRVMIIVGVLVGGTVDLGRTKDRERVGWIGVSVGLGLGGKVAKRLTNRI